jgi:signal transduction histidine kinase/ligand-binding sensor domain-containing protein
LLEKSRGMGKGFVIVLLIFIAFIFDGQSQNPSFRRINSSEGLSNSWVRCFFQDDLGFIWVGTSDGLNRFDGKQLKVFRPSTPKGINLGNVTVNSIIKQNDSLLWIATDGGLFSFNMINETMEMDTLLPPHPVLCMVKDHQNNFWFGTNNGLFFYQGYHKILNRFSTESSQTNAISNNYIGTLLVDSDANLWVGTKKGLNRFNRTRKDFEHIHDKMLYQSEDIRCIYEDRQKNIWVGTAHNGLKLMKHSTNNIRFEHILDGSISDVYADLNNRLWVAHSNEAGIYLLDPIHDTEEKPKFITLKNDPLDEQSLSDNSAFRFFEDQTGDLWIGTYGNGINYYSPRAKAFRNVTEQYNKEQSIYNNLVNCFYEEEAYLWIGTEGGLDRLNKKTGRFEHFQNKPGNQGSLASNPVLSVFKDSGGNLWVGTWAGGLHRFNYQNNTFKRYQPDGKPGSLGSENVSVITEDHQKRLWVGTVSGGLNLFDPANESFTCYRKNPADSTSLAGRSMNDLLVTRKGELYISLYSAVDRYNESTNSFEHISRMADEQYQPATITDLFEDSRGNLWLATNAGLELLDSSGHISRVYTTINGLPDNTIQAILEDDHGNLWLSTNRGIACFINGIHAPDNPEFQHFTLNDGLLSNNFKSRAAMKNSDGHFYFGSLNGYTWFHPDSIRMNNLQPKIAFTYLLVQYASPNEYTNYKPYNANLNFASKIDLSYPNTNFIIGFAALNYLNPEENQYQYKLEGYDTEWVNALNSNTATYTNIPEGTYRFLVTGSNNDGVWATSPASITIVIHPAWWQSFLFKFVILVLVFLVSLTIIAIRFISLSRTNLELEARVNKRTMELTRLNHLLEEKNDKISEQNVELEKHQNHLENLVADRTIELEDARMKAEESNRLKSAFLANMSHEIRTPMNAIIGFSSMLADSGLPDEKRVKYIQQVKTNGNNLNMLINDIIDISLIEAKQLNLHPTIFDVSKLLNDLHQVFMLENKDHFVFEYDNMNDPQNLMLNNDAHRFRQIMVNLLSNAFKYSEKGVIRYGYEVYETEVQFYVKDDGIGIDHQEQENIFMHFYKSNKNKSKLYRGTGIGLAICKNLVTQMGGKIWVESEWKKGSTFYFTLPLEQR